MLLQIRRLLQAPAPAPLLEAIKLIKIKVSTFKGDIVGWRTFWEQFNDSVHSKLQLSSPVKLAYHREALKDDPVRHAIECLSGMESSYRETIKMLKEHYDRPLLLHQAHVRVIVKAPSLKDGSGKELDHVHDVLAQHLRAFKVMEYEPSPFVTSLI